MENETEIAQITDMVTFYCLFFIHLSTRKIYIAGCTSQPNSEWVAQQARNFSMYLADKKNEARRFIHDRDRS